MLKWLVDFSSSSSSSSSSGSSAFSSGTYSIDANNSARSDVAAGNDGVADPPDVDLDVGAMITKLVLIVLTPLLVGKLARSLPGVVQWTTAHKWMLKVISVYALVALPWMKASKAADENKFDGMTFESIAATIGWALTIMAVRSYAYSSGRVLSARASVCLRLN